MSDLPPRDAPQEIAAPLPASPDGVGARPAEASVRRTARASVNLGCAGLLVATLLYQSTRGSGGEPSTLLILALFTFSGLGWIFAIATWWIDRKLPQRIAKKRALFGFLAPIFALALVIGGFFANLRLAQQERALSDATQSWERIRALDWNDAASHGTLRAALNSKCQAAPSEVFVMEQFGGVPASYDVRDVVLLGRGKFAQLELVHRDTQATASLRLRRSGKAWSFTHENDAED